MRLRCSNMYVLCTCLSTHQLFCVLTDISTVSVSFHVVSFYWHIGIIKFGNISIHAFTYPVGEYIDACVIWFMDSIAAEELSLESRGQFWRHGLEWPDTFLPANSNVVKWFLGCLYHFLSKTNITIMFFAKNEVDSNYSLYLTTWNLSIIPENSSPYSAWLAGYERSAKRGANFFLT